MNPNRNHPDFPEFEKKWNKLWNDMENEVKVAEEIERRKGGKPCQDSPIDMIRKRYNTKISALQKNYHYLYE